MTRDEKVKRSLGSKRNTSGGLLSISHQVGPCEVILMLCVHGMMIPSKRIKKQPVWCYSRRIHSAVEFKPCIAMRHL